jgi:urate oxidase
VPSILSNKYGKANVRLTYADRSRNPHDLRELSIDILLEGDFASAYTDGDNAAVLPTDTMKNTVYVLARQLSWDSPELLGQGIARHFLERSSHVSAVHVDIEQIPWTPIGKHGAAFTQTGNERRTARVKAISSGVELSSGIDGLQILKTADSGFSGFLKDEFTTLAETDDRLFGTVLQAEWRYLRIDLAFNECYRQVREVLLECFAEHKSRSVQHTLYAMAEAALNAIRTIGEIHIVMPNKHCLLVDLSRFGLDNPNRVFVPIDEPSGYIEARLRR